MATLQEDLVDALAQKAHALLRAGKHVEAEALYRRLLALCPPDEYALEKCWGNLGSALAGQGRKEEAIDALKRSLVINPDYGVAQRNLEIIRSQTPVVLAAQPSCTGSVLEPGDFHSAHSAWKKLMGNEEAGDNPAVRDADAFLAWFLRTGGCRVHRTPPFTFLNRREQSGLLPLSACRELNALLATPESHLFTFAGPNGKHASFKKEREVQFQTVFRLRHLLTKMSLLQQRGRLISIGNTAAEFLSEDPVFRFSSLLWCYLCLLEWQDLDHAFRTKKIQSPASVIQHDLGTSINMLLSGCGDGGWFDVSPLRYFKNENDDDSDDSDESEMRRFGGMMLVITQCNFLWRPLVWFGLLEGRMGEDLFGHTDLFAVRQTDLGKRIISTLTRTMHSTAGPAVSASFGRNDPCPCGAAKSDGTPVKFKRCCGK